MAANRATLLIMAGEGIGPEVLAQSRRAAEWLVAHRGLDVSIEEELYGIDAYKAYGRLLREEALPRMRAADAILFRATGSLTNAALPAEVRASGSLLGIRKSSA